MLFNLPAWLAYIEQKNPDQMHLGLDHLRPIAKFLNLIDWAIPVVTIAGTNGKGSTLAALDSFLRAAEKNVGCYTSPHLIFFNERIKINNQSVTDEKLCEAFAVIEQARGGQTLTYFEWATFAALWIFKQAELDFLLLEVGLGGRLDAVNLVNNNISIITGIDYDHQDWLGSSLEDIAAEKAGIFKPGQIALCAQPNAPEIIRCRAEELNIKFLDRNNFGYEKIVGAGPSACPEAKGNHRGLPLQNSTWHWYGKTASGDDLCYADLPNHTVPFSNLAVAIQALQFCLPDVSKIIVEQGLNHLSIAGRLQRLPTKKPVLVDVAHNPQSVAYLVRYLQQGTYDKIHLVIGMLADKDHEAMLKIFLPYVDAWYLTELSSARALPAEQLRAYLTNAQAKVIGCYASVLCAYEAAYEASSVNELLVICGSFYTVAPVLAFEDGKNKDE